MKQNNFFGFKAEYEAFLCFSKVHLSMFLPLLATMHVVDCFDIDSVERHNFVFLKYIGYIKDDRREQTFDKGFPGNMDRVVRFLNVDSR